MHLEKKLHAILINLLLDLTDMDNKMKRKTIFFTGTVKDLNLEHAQLLLFMFHALNLMQKKSVLLVTAGGVTCCTEMLRQPMRASLLLHLSHLLLLLEYLMKHLYDPPQALLEH
jgi:E3 ubiquitin-protein ligase UBR4